MYIRGRSLGLFPTQRANTLRTRIAIYAFAIALALAGNHSFSQAKDQPQSAPTSEKQARHIIGLQKIKHNADGNLKLQPAEIEFDSGRASANIPISSIEDVFVGTETTEAGGTVGVVLEGASMAAPYDSGAVLPILLREKVDVLTITFRDSDGGLNAAIFALTKGRATQIRADLISHGVHVSASDSTAASAVSGGPAPDANSPAPAPSTTNTTGPNHSPAPAIQIEQLMTGEIHIPAEFRLAIYENLIEKLTKSGIFPHVFRSGDRRADGVDDLLTLRPTLDKFKQGNQMERRLTSVLGTTKIKVHAQILNRKSETVQAVVVEGKVRIFGENLGATSDVAKRITKALRKSSF